VVINYRHRCCTRVLMAGGCAHNNAGGTMERKKLDQLVTQLHIGNDRQRRASSYRLSKSKDPSVVPELISAYYDKDSSVRQNAYDGLRSIGSEEALDFLASHEENAMNILPSMDNKTIECDGNNVVTIRSNPLLVYVMGVIIGIFGVGYLAQGGILLGVVGIVAGVMFFLWARNKGTSFEFNPNTRIFKIGSSPKSINVSFDDIAAFDVATMKERGNFTEKKILVVFKDNRTFEIGVITDANEVNREDKVVKLLEFLNKKQGFNIDENNWETHR
jgi:hypothetical protein